MENKPRKIAGKAINDDPVAPRDERIGMVRIYPHDDFKGRNIGKARDGLQPRHLKMNAGLEETLDCLGVPWELESLFAKVASTSNITPLEEQDFESSGDH